MMLTCPKCGDYYADGPSAFCLSDGTPLAEVDPRGERWDEATRVVGEKARALLKRERRLRLRRLLTRATTLLVVCLVVFVAAVNSYIYLRPAPGGDVWARILAPVPEPTPEPAPALEPIPTPRTKPTQTATPACSDRDKARAREAINARYGPSWADDISADCRETIVDRGPPVLRGGVPEPRPAGFAFAKSCSPVVVTVSYKCRGERRVNGTVEPVSVTKKKRVECRKSGGAWVCG